MCSCICEEASTVMAMQRPWSHVLTHSRFMACIRGTCVNLLKVHKVPPEPCSMIVRPEDLLHSRELCKKH